MQKFTQWLEGKDNELAKTFNEGKKPKKWIGKIDIKKGAFTDYCGGEVTSDCIEKALKSEDPHVVRMASLAKTLRKISKKKKKKKKKS